MCGIGLVLHRERFVAEAALDRVVAAQEHRGPDRGGKTCMSFAEKWLALGHRRLSIIDISDRGSQPMVHPETGDQLVYNGEIYNFRVLREELIARGCRFRGDSDSEVLLHALTEWGPAAIHRLQGMFAFAYVKKATNEVIIARDPLGIKPLYFSFSAGTLVCASEVRAILKSGLVSPEIDRRGLAGLLAYGAVQHPFTLFKAIHSFPAGCYGQLIPGQTEIIPQPFWQAPAPNGTINEAEALEAIRFTIDAAVRDHLVSDVPLAVFLSSGIDSSIVAGLAARHSANLRSFTVGFADTPNLSELEMAAKTARAFGMVHTPCLLRESDALSTSQAWLKDLDLPSIDGLNVYIISQAVRQQGVKVALSGQGGDEMFGGYSSFSQVPALHALLGKVGWVPPRMRQSLTRMATARMSASFREKAWAFAGSRPDLLTLYTHRRRLLSERQMAAMGLTGNDLHLSEEFFSPEESAGFQLDEKDAVWSISALETQLYLGNMLLRDGDANGMAHGLEIRVPLLDQRVVDLAMSLPGSVRLPSGKANKSLLRKAFPEFLRPELLSQRKRGFTLPIAAWMQGPLQNVADAGFEKLKESGLVDPKGVESIRADFAGAPNTPIWSRAYLCWVLGAYLEQVDHSITQWRLAS